MLEQRGEFAMEELEVLNMHLAVSHLNLASIHSAEGKIDDAIFEYTKALEFDPNIYLVYVNRGRLLWKRGEYKHALDDLSRAINLEPLIPSTYVWRGDVYLALGNREAAEKDYLKALELSPSDGEISKRIEKLRKGWVVGDSPRENL